MPHWVLIIIFSILLLPGIVGVILPVFPSIPYMFLVALIFAAIDKFDHITGLNLLLLGIIAAISLAIDYLAGLFGAKYFGATGKGVLGGVIGGFIGLLVFPPWGLIIGMALGVFLAEYLINKKAKEVNKAVAGVLIGSLTGIVINLIFSIIFLALFLIFALN